jgi:hypothetical protein
MGLFGFFGIRGTAGVTPSGHTRQDKRGAPLITQGLGRHRLALLLAFLLVIEHGDRLGRQLL